MPSRERAGVLVVCGPWDGRGGLQQQLRSLIAEVARDVPVTVMTWGRRGPRRDCGANIVRLPSPWPWTNELSPWRGRVNVAVAILTAVPAAVLRRRRWSVALAVGLQPEGAVAALAALLARRRFVARTWLVGPLGNVARLRASAARTVALRLLRRADAVLGETDEAAAELRDLGLDARRVHLVPCGIDLVRWRPPGPAEVAAARGRFGLGDAAGVLAYWGRFDLRQKRLDILIAAWRSARPEGWRLLLVGDGPDAGCVAALAAAAGPSVVLAPWQDDVFDAAAAADVFALPTEAETTAQALLEGLAAALPGIVSAAPGMRARQPEGVLLVENAVSAWSQAIAALVADAERRAALGAAGRRWVEHHHDAARLAGTFREMLGV